MKKGWAGEAKDKAVVGEGGEGKYTQGKVGGGWEGCVCR